MMQKGGLKEGIMHNNEKCNWIFINVYLLLIGCEAAVRPKYTLCSPKEEYIR